MHRLEALQVKAETLTTSLAAFDSCSDDYFNHALLDAPVMPDSFVLLKSTEAALLRTLLNVRQAMNACSPINRLPADVLKSIFVWLSPKSTGDFLAVVHSNPYKVSGSPSPQLSLHHWLRVASVCRRWRDVAISCSSLWSSISIGPKSTPSSKVALQLRYSGNAPIDFHAHVEAQRIPPEMLYCPSFDWSTLPLKSIIPRLRSFHLPSSVRDADGIYEQLTEPAPLLEHLTLSPISHLRSDTRIPGMYVGPSDPPIPVLPRIFQDELPRLKTLTISKFVTWPENNFRGLIRLCLCDQTPNSLEHQIPLLHRRLDLSASCTRSYLIDLLNNSPDLEELVLANAFTITNDNSTNQLRLRKLKTLIVSGWDRGSASIFFSALELPVSCAVSFGRTTFGGSALDVLKTRSSLLKISDFLHGMTRIYFVCNPIGPPYPPRLLACGKGGLYLEGSGAPAGRMMNNQVAPSSFVNDTELYSAMSVNELWVDTLSCTSQTMTTVQWASLYDSMPGITKLVIVLREHSSVDLYWDFPCILALCGRDGLPCLPNLAELHLIYTQDITSAPLAALQLVKEHRDTLEVPINKLVVGARPPLELYEETIADIRGMLGPDVVCGIQDLSFDWAPFSERTHYERYWPHELRGRCPGLWSVQ